MAIANQIANRNFLSPIGFKFTIAKDNKIDFFSNSARIPGITLGTALQPTPLKMLDVPGDILQYEDFTLDFLVDENLENYMQIQKWIRGLGYPESLKEIFDLQNEPPNVDNRVSELRNIYSDGSLIVLNSTYNPQFKVVFQDMFPYQLTSLQFNSGETDIEYFTAEVSFKYTIYNITDMKGNRL